MPTGERRSDPLPAARRRPRPSLDRLRDGSAVRLRPVLPSDQPRIAAFLAHVSVDSLERRYFSAVTPEHVALEIVGPPVARDRLSLLVELVEGRPGPVIAHGECDRLPTDPTRAEVAFLVADDRQGQGAATLLLREIARRAAADGVAQLEAVVQAENRPMVDVFLGSGFPCSIAWQEGEGHVVLDISHEPTSPGLPRGASCDYPLVPA
ncbi:MAG TPA: GNAT family N-acetyltransferase [Thermoplasmata archaeon]|nr:GNAT family N-acetyltransferase [Thermoplasmata archaeon]